MMQKKHMDTGTLEMLLEILEEGFPMLLETFIDDSQLRVNDIRAGFAGRDTDGVRRSAHSLKGSSSNVGALVLADLSQTLELAAQNSGLDGMAGTVDAIEAEFIAVKNSLAKWLAEVS